jgi:hypothetical protein
MNESSEQRIEKPEGGKTYTDAIHQNRSHEILHDDAPATPGDAYCLNQS